MVRYIVLLLLLPIVMTLVSCFDESEKDEVIPLEELQPWMLDGNYTSLQCGNPERYLDLRLYIPDKRTPLQGKDGLGFMELCGTYEFRITLSWKLEAEKLVVEYEGIEEAAVCCGYEGDLYASETVIIKKDSLGAWDTSQLILQGITWKMIG